MFKKDIKTKDFMHIMITHRCNYNCPFCFDLNRGKAQDITISNFQKILRIAKKRNLKEITFVGDEPTLHPKVIQLAKMVKENGFKFNCNNKLYKTPNSKRVR